MTRGRRCPLIGTGARLGVAPARTPADIAWAAVPGTAHSAVGEDGHDATGCIGARLAMVASVPAAWQRELSGGRHMADDCGRAARAAELHLCFDLPDLVIRGVREHGSHGAASAGL